MNSLLDSSLISLLVVAVAATGGIFLAVVLGGVVSALITLGALELGYRAKIQRSVLERYFRLGDEVPPLAAANPLQVFLAARYPVPAAPAYAELLVQLDLKHTLVPALAQMDADGLYRLHYRQICGQLMGVVNNEALKKEGQQTVVTPLTDVLAFLSSRRTAVLRVPALQGPATTPDKRSDLDLALREIDGIQATLGNGIGKATFPYMQLAWIAVYGVTLILAALSLPFSYTGSMGALSVTVVQHAFVVLGAALGGLVLAIGTAVFGAVAFTSLDRFLASK
jgi:hypothetical protein